jgi:hypothetical protein
MLDLTARPERALAAMTVAICVALLLNSSPALAGDWTNLGGDPGRDGLSTVIGPTSPELRWSGGGSSLYAWPVFSAGHRVFTVRQIGYPPPFTPIEVPVDAPVVCYDLDTGATLWTVNLPWNPGEWTTWVGGTGSGRVYASRSGNGGTAMAKLYALDQATGAVVWASADPIRAETEDGPVFAPNGDILLGWESTVTRIAAADGRTVWATPRTCFNCGVVTAGAAVYSTDIHQPAGHVLSRWDLATGVLAYQSEVMAGFDGQNTAVVGPDGVIYLSGTEGGADLLLYSFTDTGTAFTLNWKIPVPYTAFSGPAVAPDGSVYTMAPVGVIARLDPHTGATLASSSPLVTVMPNVGLEPRLAVDAAGSVFVANGGTSDGALFVLAPDLTPLWSVPVPDIGFGAPCLAEDGTLLVAGTGTTLLAYGTPIDGGAGVGGGSSGTGGAGTTSSSGTGGSSDTGGAGGTSGTGGAATTTTTTSATTSAGGGGAPTGGSGGGRPPIAFTGCYCEHAGGPRSGDAPSLTGVFLLLAGVLGRRAKRSPP